MVEKRFCDIAGCNEETWREKVDVCIGWLEATEYGGKRTNFKPFEHPDVVKRDLCDKHYRMWCRATYEIFHGKVES